MDKMMLSVDEFCHTHGICRASFYNLLKRGDGPKIAKTGGRTLISTEAAAAWRRQMEEKTSSAEKLAS
ncbi:MAG TPA: hypothetical protein VFC54_05085 [Pseudolabrys sp.]|nr:hypothetical protein [Pseudolabrys sp.]